MSTAIRLTKKSASQLMEALSRTIRNLPPSPPASHPPPPAVKPATTRRQFGKRSLPVVLLLCLLSSSPVEASPPPPSRWTVEVKGMSCPLCAKNIEKQILRVIPAASVKIDLGTGAVEVRSSTPPLDAASKIRLAIISAGFTPGEVSSSK